MVGRLLSFGEGLFLGAKMLVSGSVLPSRFTCSRIKSSVTCRVYLHSLGIQSPCQRMIGVSNHLRNAKYLGSMLPFSEGDWIPRDVKLIYFQLDCIPPTMLMWGELVCLEYITLSFTQIPFLQQQNFAARRSETPKDPVARTQ